MLRIQSCKTLLRHSRFCTDKGKTKTSLPIVGKPTTSKLHSVLGENTHLPNEAQGSRPQPTHTFHHKGNHSSTVRIIERRLAFFYVASSMSGANSCLTTIRFGSWINHSNIEVNLAAIFTKLSGNSQETKVSSRQVIKLMDTKLAFGEI